MKKERLHRLLSLLLAVIIVFSVASAPVYALENNSAYSSEKCVWLSSTPDNPIVSEEPYPQTEQEIALYGKDDSTLVTYADGTEAIVSAITINVPSPGLLRSAIPVRIEAVLSTNENGTLTAKIFSSLETWDTDLTFTLYYGVLRDETAANVKRRINVTLLGPSGVSMKATISTTKFFALEFDGVCCGEPVYYESVNHLYNKKAILYPRYTCPVSGRTVAMPYSATYAKTPTHTWNGRTKYIKYFNDTYNGGKDPWNWDNYEIHHIRPKGFGGDDDYSNLFPLPKYPFNIHNDFTQWWRYYQ